MDELTAKIARNLASLREQRKYSLDDLSRLTGVSKSMLRQIEKGESSPTVSTLWKIANGLKISFSSLVESPVIDTQVIDSASIEPMREDSGRYRIHTIFPFDPVKKFEIHYVEVDEGSLLSSEGHMAGVEEYVLVCEGILAISVGEKEYKVGAGQSIKFKADEMHRYRNDSGATVKCIKIIWYP